MTPDKARMPDMTPDEARALYFRVLQEFRPGEDLPDIHRALATLAAMRVEHDHGVVDPEQADGRYETYRRVRLVSDWRDA